LHSASSRHLLMQAFMCILNERGMIYSLLLFTLTTSLYWVHEFSEHYEMTDLGEIQSYLGMCIVCDRSLRCIEIDQSGYITVLEHFCHGQTNLPSCGGAYASRAVFTIRFGLVLRCLCTYILGLLVKTHIVLVCLISVISLCGMLAWYSVSHDVPCHSSLFHCSL
jgi:hypothetical protein